MGLKQLKNGKKNIDYIEKQLKIIEQLSKLKFQVPSCPWKPQSCKGAQDKKQQIELQTFNHTASSCIFPAIAAWIFGIGWKRQNLHCRTHSSLAAAGLAHAFATAAAACHRQGPTDDNFAQSGLPAAKSRQQQLPCRTDAACYEPGKPIWSSWHLRMTSARVFKDEWKEVLLRRFNLSADGKLQVY